MVLPNALTALLASAIGEARSRKLTRGWRDLLITDLNEVGSTTNQNNVEFDVVILGGGTAGCVLASRLSEDPSIRVLLLESGGSGISLEDSRIPCMHARIMHTENCWNYFTEPQTALVGDFTSKFLPQGRMLGGSSSMNAMVSHYGAPEDLDEWPEKNSDPGSEIWSYKQFHKYFLKFEKYVSSKGSSQVDTTLHGSDGPVKVGFVPHWSEVSAKFIKSCVEAGIPHVHDLNTHRGSYGVSQTMTYIDSRGQRVSAESAYLTPNVLSRPNLKVAIHAQVTRILFDKIAGKPKAVGVEFANTRDGPRFRATARKQVIVCAGAMHTPQILMLSGVGPAKQLAAHSIPLVHDLPGVGDHLMDHIAADIRYRDLSEGGINLMPRSFGEKLGIMWHYWKWKIFGTGILTCNGVEAVAFVRSTDSKLFSADETPPIVEDSASGPSAPDVELIFTPAAFIRQGAEGLPPSYYWSVRACLLRPTSFGTITLKSADPFQGPIIDPKYLTTEHDVNVLVRGLKLVMRIASTHPLSDTMDKTATDSRLDHDKLELNDGQLRALAKDRVESMCHPCCTARMAPLDEGGVVDPYLRVHGVSNLRVVDASVFPTIVSGHTAGVVLAIAEQASDLIKSEISTASPPTKSYH